MNNTVELIDAEDNDALKYPSIKSLTGETPDEIRVDIVTRDIIPPDAFATLYFPYDFCTGKIVIDLVAKKYAANAENYFSNAGDEDRFLIGYDSCSKKVRDKLDCPYMKKFNERIEKLKKFSPKSIFAVYLLELDDSDDNNQKFLFMTRNELCLFYATKELERYSYSDIRFMPDGVELKSPAQDVERKLLEWEFNEKFFNFAREFMLLRCTTLADVRTRHPVADMRDDVNNPDIVTDIAATVNLNETENEMYPSYKRRSTYLNFLVNVATAEGYVDAETLLRLAYMAREFHIPADEVQSWLKDAYAGDFLKKKLQRIFVDVLETVGEKNKFALIQDAIEVATDSEGNFHRAELLKIFKRQQLGVEKFAESYIAYVKKRKAAERDLQLALQVMDKQQLHIKSAVRMQNYGDAINLQIAMMNAMI